MKAKKALLRYGVSALMLSAALLGALAPACAADKKPNIVVIWGDDIGTWNVGAYTHGMMGRTPHIDSIARPACCSPITMASPVVRPAALRSSWDNSPFAPA